MKLLFVFATMAAASSNAQYVAQILPTPTGGGIANGAGSGQIVGDAFGDLGGAPCVWDGPQHKFYSLSFAGYSNALALGAGGGKQVGYGIVQPESHALMWSGPKSGIVDLHTNQFSSTIAYGTDGMTQVGAGSPFQFGVSHAVYWRGTAASAVSLHPAGFDLSEARDVFGNVQVGDVSGATDRGAAIWRGTPESMQILPRPPGFVAGGAVGIHGSQVVGSIAGLGAVLWDIDKWTYTLLGAGFATDTNGFYQVGEGAPQSPRAIRWSGSANSALDLQQFLPKNVAYSRATGIDENGTIVGRAHIDSFGWVPVVWTPVPEPSGLFALALGIGALAMRRRRKR